MRDIMTGDATIILLWEQFGLTLLARGRLVFNLK
jgi:hypothetical protein